MTITGMRTIIKSHDIKDLVIVQDFPDNFSAAGLQERMYSLDIAGTAGHTHELLMQGICIEHRNVSHTQPFEIEVQHDFPFFKMHFELKGFSNYERSNKGSQDVSIDHGCHQLFFFPEVYGRLQYAAQQRYTLEIKLTLDFVKRIMENDMEALGKLGWGIDKLQPVRLGHKSLPILPAMKKVIYEVVHPPYTGPLKKIFLEAKVTELLLLQLAQFEQADTLLCKSVLRKGDPEKIHYVRELIEQNMQEPCSLLELAAKAGLNDFKLKKGFKEVYGTTVFGYMTDARMEKARDLLLQGRHSIADIAFTVGYKNPQHFTAAFKRKFGYLPSELKK